MGKLLITKFRDNFLADKFLFACKKLSLAQKIQYVLTKYQKIVFNKSRIKYIGKQFVYDNRFTPVLLEFYPHEIEFLIENIKFSTTDKVLDVGANIGQWAFTFKSYYPKTKIYSFEPNKSAFKLLEENASKFDDWYVFNYAIGKKKGKKHLYCPVGASAGGSFYSSMVDKTSMRNRVKKELVDVVNMGNIRTKHNLPKKYKLVKIDVEGFELEVLKSLVDVKFDYLFIEIPLKAKRNVNTVKIEKLIKLLFHKKPELVGISKSGDFALAANALYLLK